MPDLDKSMIDAISTLTAKGLPVQLQDVAIVGSSDPIQGRRYLLVSDGGKPKDITDDLLGTLPNPQNRTGHTTLTSLDSLSAYVNRMKEPSSVLFADKDAKQIRCVFDYHEAVNVFLAEQTDPNAPADPAAPVAAGNNWSPAPRFPLPRWGRFSASYAFPYSQSWKRWAGKNKDVMSQGALADWIEDNIDDVKDTEDAKQLGESAFSLIGTLGLNLANRTRLIQAARGLSLKVTERVAQAVNTTSGEVSIQYSQEHTNESPAQVQVPSAFALALPVFEGGDWFTLLTRLRYRKSDGNLHWWFDVYKLEKAVETAFTSACEKVSQETGLPLFYAKLT